MVKMRKIVSAREMEKRNQRNQIIVGIVLASLMIFSVLAYAFQGRDSSSDSSDDSEEGVYNYNEFEFLYQNGFWAVDFLDSFLLFSYYPVSGQILGFETLNKSYQDYENKTVYVYSDDSEAKSELKINLLLLTKDIQEFCLEGKTCENAELPVKSCSALGNAGNEEMIVIQENSQQKLETLGNCIVISGQKESLIKLVDEFLFRLFKIKTE